MRTVNSVNCKIIYIKGNCKTAHDWGCVTVQDVKENEFIDYFQQRILRYCKYYYILYDIIEDRYSSRPSASTEYFYYPDEEIQGPNF